MKVLLKAAAKPAASGASQNLIKRSSEEEKKLDYSAQSIDI
jgi:hypothetical protein